MVLMSDFDTSGRAARRIPEPTPAPPRGMELPEPVARMHRWVETPLGRMVVAVGPHDGRPAITGCWFEDQKHFPDDETLGAGGTGRGSAAAVRGSAGQIKELERRQRSRATSVQRDALDRALVDLAGFYRDVLLVHSRADHVCSVPLPRSPITTRLPFRSAMELMPESRRAMTCSTSG